MANTRQLKRCPECGAVNSAENQRCVICDTLLVKRSPATQRPFSSSRPTISVFDSHEGEDDLMARGVFNTPIGALVGCVILVLIAGAALGAFLTLNQDDPIEDSSIKSLITPSVTSSVSSVPSPFPTNTRPVQMFMATITPLPATPTPTPTEGPCIKTARLGDTLYGLAQQCGHRHLSIVDVVVEVNDLACTTCLQEGQTIEIPWPTPTPGGEEIIPDAATEVSMAGSANSNGAIPTAAVNEFGTPDAFATFQTEPTLRPGLMWHTVSLGETLITIASIYNADAKVLSDINPEVEFSQCDFSMRFGGEQCAVMLFEGQRIRVPAPTPTPTLSLTPSGSETPTPTVSPTFNIPAAFSPDDNADFDKSNLITLRWTASGTLASNEVYLVTVKNKDTNETFQAQTIELFFVLPDSWQPRQDRRQEFEWSISIAVIDNNRIILTREPTTPRLFTWQG